jgi:hypothetical protein
MCYQRSTLGSPGNSGVPANTRLLEQNEGLGLLRNVGSFGGKRPTALAPFFVRTLPDPHYDLRFDQVPQPMIEELRFSPALTVREG